jgi:hypothetical protein
MQAADYVQDPDASELPWTAAYGAELTVLSGPDGRRPGPVAVLIHPAAADTIHDADSCALPRLQPDRRRALFRACEVPDHAWRRRPMLLLQCARACPYPPAGSPARTGACMPPPLARPCRARPLAWATDSR